MGRPAKKPVDWRGQVTLGVGEKVRRAEPEASVLQRVQEALWVAGGVHVMRNTVGFVKKGQRGIKYGLGVGSSDVVAIVAPFGRWLCIETKRGKGGVVEPEQEAWLAKMKTYGAVVGVCRSPEEALVLVEEARRPWNGERA
jgi:hypothetical protein